MLLFFDYKLTLVHLEKHILFCRGFRPKPHFIFFLDKKNEAKKIKTSPASLKKLALEKLKSSKLLSVS